MTVVDIIPVFLIFAGSDLGTRDLITLVAVAEVQRGGGGGECVRCEWGGGGGECEWEGGGGEV